MRLRRRRPTRRSRTSSTELQRQRLPRGAPDAAALLAAEAVRLTPPDDEAARVRRTFVGAGYLMEAGDVPEARARIEPLLEPSLPPAVRSQALVFRAETEHKDRTR